MNTSVSVIHYLCHALAMFAEDVASRSQAVAKTGVAGIARRLKVDSDLLLQAWSDMARRNLLADLLRGVRAIQAAQQPIALANLKVAFDSGKAIGGARAPRHGVQADDAAAAIPDLCRDLVKRIDALLLKHSPSQARYSQVACFGYRVKVAGDTYTGGTDDAADLRVRCDDMKQAIRAAYALADRDGRNFNGCANLLKVFMAPEFFFRGGNGAYDHAVIAGTEGRTDDQGRKLPASRGLLDMMLEELSRPQYKDWLFVLGTAIAATEHRRHLCMAPGCGGEILFDKGKPVCTEDRAHRVIERSLGAVVDNIGFIVKEGEVHTVSKELVSHIDFVKDKAKGQRDVVTVTGGAQPKELGVRRHPKPSGYTAASGKATKFSDERMGGCVFTIDGITIGVEVCLDHAATADSGHHGRLAHAGNIQLQLIPSAGMSIHSLSTLPGGVVFNVDGLTPHVYAIGGGMNPRVQMNQQNRFYRFDGANWGDLRPVGTDLDKLAELEKNAKGYWMVPPAPVHGPGGKGTVVMFGPFDLPKL